MQRGLGCTLKSRMRRRRAEVDMVGGAGVQLAQRSVLQIAN